MQSIHTPGYDRSGVECGIAHLGVGGFHRSHQALAIDRLLEQGLARDWGILGVGVLPSDTRMRDALGVRDGRYTLVEKHADGHWDARDVGSILEFVHAPDDRRAAVERLADPAIRILSLTITEGGYPVDRETRAFVPGASAPAFDLIVAALRHRRELGRAPFTVLSCDNIQDNGAVARAAVTGFARQTDPELAHWIDAEVAFPSSMVDRITPATTDADRAEIARRFGPNESRQVAEPWPVVAEPFFQWVIEDDFPQGRPPWERAGAQLVADVEPYELMKLRLLNASHQGLCYFGRLLGYEFVADAARDPDIASLLRRYMHEEALPTLRPVPGVDLEAYTESLIERFANPEVADTVARLCAHSSDRIPTWLLPVVRERRATGARAPLAAAIVASWARYAEGVDEQGRPIDVVDRRREAVLAAARRRTDEAAFLRQHELFGDLADDPVFTADYLAALRRLRAEGARAALRALR